MQHEKRTNTHTPVWTDPAEAKLNKSSLCVPEGQGQTTMTYGERGEERGYLWRVLAWWGVGRKCSKL